MVSKEEIILKEKYEGLFLEYLNSETYTVLKKRDIVDLFISNAIRCNLFNLLYLIDQDRKVTVDIAFVWGDTKEGSAYWKSVALEVDTLRRKNR